VNGGYVSNTGGFLGYYSNSVGTATVSDGTWANSIVLTVGHGGTGTLNVTGGSVTSTDGWLGYDAGGVGTATVSSGTWANSGDLFVGYLGTGTLNVTGGSVTNTIGLIGGGGYVGVGEGRVVTSGVGTATVSSGTWANSGDLFVGLSGTGTLIVNGGSVTSEISFIGGGQDGAGHSSAASARRRCRAAHGPVLPSALA
jgi:T5SS/PEP-CTERM-associated repeat protein